jgi:RecA-family ATPase
MQWHGHTTKKGPVLYVAGEGVSGLSKRIAAWRQARLYHSKEQIPIFGATTSLALTDPRTAAAVIDAVNKDMPDTPPAAIFIDTLARCFGDGDENSNTDSSAAVRTLDAIKAAFPLVAVFIIHHVGHNERKRGRGASAFYDAMDFVFLAELKGGKTLLDGTIVLTCTKMKDAEYPPDIALSAERVDLPELNGKPRNSLVLHRVDSIPETGPEMKPKGENQVSIMRLLNKLHSESGGGVMYEKLMQAAKEKGIGKSSWYRAYDSLKDDKHLISEYNGICYPSNSIPDEISQKMNL